MRTLSVFAVALALGCAPMPGTDTCSPSTCSGCCTSAGECRQGLDAAACGASGAACISCGAGATCVVGACSPSNPRPDAGGSAGGGSAGGEVSGGGDAAAGGMAGGTAGGTVAGGGSAGGGTMGGGTAGGATSGGAPTSGACAGTLVQCGQACVDLAADLENCGGCGVVCRGGEVCNRGTCALLPTDCTSAGASCGPGFFCDPATRTCATGCRLSTDCPAGATCASGVCTCPANQRACGQRCVANASTNGVACCLPGYAASGSGCVDVDECLLGNGGCSLDATCTNTVGSRTCACKPGFGGDGLTCTDLNECASGNGGCHVSATCTNTPGSHTCACNPGFLGDGLTCSVDACFTNNGGCSEMAICTNQASGRTCACRAGFTGDGLTCLDIDECATNNGGCPEGCANTPGGFECTPVLWMNRTTTTSPSARSGHAVAADTQRGVVVLFGGNNGVNRLGDTWEHDGQRWRQSNAVGPVPRSDHAMSFDTARNRVVLFGGYSPGTARNDTWEYDGTTWTQRSPTTSPPGRWLHTMVYDSARGRTVLFGGVGSNGLLGDTWEYDGTTWTQRTVTGPSPRQDHSMAYDSARQRVQVFGGAGADLWEFDGTNWTLASNTSPSPDPGNFTGQAMGYDPVRRRTVVFSGRIGGNRHARTFEWNGVFWLDVTANSTRYHVEGAAMAWTRGGLLSFGGISSTTLNNATWVRGPRPTYAISTVPVACDPSAGAVLSSPLPEGWYSSSIPLSFDVRFFGDQIDSLKASARGYLETGRGSSTSSGVNLSIPTTGALYDVIAPYWDDLKPLAGATLSTNLVGTAPQRARVFQWSNLRTNQGSNNQLRFQVKLFESDSAIEFHYCELTGAAASGDSATIGVQGPAGAYGVQHSFNRPGAVNTTRALRFTLVP
ncbi:MAG: hypothetical protein JNM69_14000 [Archangium sp.]|nr:hypothetical protein [Archangium sp.]